MNRERLRSDAAQRQNLGTGGDSNSLKLPEGISKLRLLDGGNDHSPQKGYGEDLPYKIHRRHELPVLASDGEQVRYCLCWDWLSEDRMNVGIVLSKMQKLDKAQVEMYQQWGCPICKAAEACKAAGITKEVVNRLWATEKIAWNTIYRADSQLYVWVNSKTVGGGIISALDTYLEAKMNPLDLRSGFDYQIRATGFRKNRRYKDGMFIPLPTPALDPNGPSTVQVKDLTEHICGNFRNYADTIGILNESMSNVLAHIGYTIPGDTTNWSNHPAAQMRPSPVGIVTPQNTIQQPAPPIAPPPIDPFTSANAPTIVTQEDVKPASDSFSQMVPESDPELEMILAKANKGKVLASKKANANRESGTYDDEIPF